MHGTIGLWIWIAIVVLGAVNSIRKKAARSSGAAPVAANRSAAVQRAQREAYLQQAAQQAAEREAVAQRAAAAQAAQLAAARQTAVQAIARKAAVPAPGPVAPGSAPPEPRRVAFPVPVPGPSGGVLDGLFEDSRNIVRGVVIAEVLGKPKALSEQPFWSLPPSVR